MSYSEQPNSWPPPQYDRRKRKKRRTRSLRIGAVIAVIAILAVVVAVSFRPHGAATSSSSSTTVASGSDSTAGTGTSLTPGAVGPGDTHDPGSFYGPINTAFAGLTMFRGNGSRTYYGQGPVPQNPHILWRFGPMSGVSDAGPISNPGAKKTWTGTGWTGEPVVAEFGGKTWIIFGAYDHRIHFLDAATGKRLLPDFTGDDLFKGSVTLDPDGYPLVYMGNRDNNWRIIAIDRGQPTELWHMNAYDTKPVMWNDDWDGNAVVRNDYAFVPGENGHFFIVKLNRAKDAGGKVTVAPQIVLDFPGWTAQELKDIGDQEVSIENSPALVGDRLYFANSGGLIHGLDVSATLKKLVPGEAPPQGAAAFPEVFSYWDGDDTDASIVVDQAGYLYVDVEYQRDLPRAQQVGQIVKLDPRKNKPGDDPLVWSVKVTRKADDGLSGVWATAALYKDMVYVPTHPGSLLGINSMTGALVWKKSFSPHAWGSASIVDHTLIVGDTYGTLHAYDVTDTQVDPPQLWTYELKSGGAIESTPAIWKGRIYVGSRDGYFYCLGD